MSGSLINHRRFIGFPALTMAVAIGASSPAGSASLELAAASIMPPLADNPIAPPSFEGPAFDDEIWAGSTAVHIQPLIEALPSGAPSPVMRDLTRRLLLADPPASADPQAATSHLVVRGRKLADLGFTDELAAVAASDPRAMTSDVVFEALVDTHLLDGRDQEACVQAAPRLADPTTAHWRQMVVFCRLVTGQASRSLDAVAEMRSAGEGDPMFLSLAEAAATGGQPALPDGAWRSLANPDAMLLAMLRLAGHGVSAAALRVRDPARLRAIARNPWTSTQVRLEAGERAAASGALSPMELARLYLDVEFSQREHDEVLALAQRQGGPEVRSLLAQAAATAAEPPRSLALRRLAVDISRAEGAPLGVIQALLLPVEPDEVRETLAIEAARAAYAAGDWEAAERWRRTAVEQALQDPTLRPALANMWPLTLLGQPPGVAVLEPQTLENWVRMEIEGAGDAGAYSAALAIAALQALEMIPASAEIWHRFAIDDSRDTMTLPMPSVWWRLPEAAENQRVGETALLALIALGSGGPGQCHPVLLSRVLEALTTVGLHDEAQRIAAEAVWANQI